MKYQSCDLYEATKPLDKATAELVEKAEGLELSDLVRVFVVSCAVDGAVQLDITTHSKTYSIGLFEPLVLTPVSDYQFSVVRSLIPSLTDEQAEKAVIYLGLRKIHPLEYEQEQREKEAQTAEASNPGDIEVEEIPDLDEYEPGQDTPKRREPTPGEIIKRELELRRLRKDFPPPEPEE